MRLSKDSDTGRRIMAFITSCVLLLLIAHSGCTPREENAQKTAENTVILSGNLISNRTLKNCNLCTDGELIILANRKLQLVSCRLSQNNHCSIVGRGGSLRVSASDVFLGSQNTMGLHLQGSFNEIIFENCSVKLEMSETVSFEASRIQFSGCRISQKSKRISCEEVFRCGARNFTMKRCNLSELHFGDVLFRLNGDATSVKNCTFSNIAGGFLFCSTGERELDFSTNSAKRLGSGVLNVRACNKVKIRNNDFSCCSHELFEASEIQELRAEGNRIHDCAFTSDSPTSIGFFQAKDIRFRRNEISGCSSTASQCLLILDGPRKPDQKTQFSDNTISRATVSKRGSLMLVGGNRISMSGNTISDCKIPFHSENAYINGGDSIVKIRCEKLAMKNNSIRDCIAPNIFYAKTEKFEPCTKFLSLARNEYYVCLISWWSTSDILPRILEELKGTYTRANVGAGRYSKGVFWLHKLDPDNGITQSVMADNLIEPADFDKLLQPATR